MQVCPGGARESTLAHHSSLRQGLVGCVHSATVSIVESSSEESAW
jgi:hypothetical protein